MKLDKYIDHTLLKPEATKTQIENLCKEAIKYDFASVCVNPTHVAYCAKLLKNSDVKVCTVIGFPLGSNTTETKVFETKNAIENGADEIDMVINIGALKDKNYNFVKEDIESVVKAANSKLVKVILETCLLTEEEVKEACKLSQEAKADYVKTSTGFSKSGASVEMVKIMYDTVHDTMKVKASGGVRTYDDAIKMIEAGASRIGTSNGVGIVTGHEGKDL